MKRQEIEKRLAQLALADRDFHYFCHLMAPDFYPLQGREYLKTMCGELQSFYESPDEEVLLLHAPPRHGKSRTGQLFSDWIFGQNPAEKIMIGSYNGILSMTFSRAVRNVIQEVKFDENRITYGDIFPHVRIKDGEGSADMWTLEGQHASYLATSPSGTATGFGASILIIDDLVKSVYEANSEATLESHWIWFKDNMLSRLENGAKIIVIMTRWSTKDLGGRILDWCIRENKKHRVLNLKAHLGNGVMLCPDILSYKDYLSKGSAMSEEILRANYDQEPIDVKGRLYSTFKTYEDIPKDKEGNPLWDKVSAYVDTADQGSDYLASLIYGEYQNEAYLLDVYYTKEAMEKTEEEVARRLVEFEVNDCLIESNNGGRGFARAVERILRDKYRWNKTVIRWFHQSQNKKSRILSHASWVMEHIYLPVNWRDRWKDFYLSMISYQRDGKNAHDDAQDAITGIAENMGGSKWLY